MYEFFYETKVSYYFIRYDIIYERDLETNRKEIFEIVIESISESKIDFKNRNISYINFIDRVNKKTIQKIINKILEDL